MAKSANQKLKLLYLHKILSEKTDENHPLTVNQLINELAALDISAERKSIYTDLEALRQFGLDIEAIKGKSTAYYVASRFFELPELKLLVDSVQSSKFVTYKKSMALIRKLESLASKHEAQQLRRQVYVANRIKTMNESIYYNIDAIHAAIGGNRQICFKYYEYTITKELHFKRNGALYRISPYALCWEDENYYMLGYDSEAGIMKHYRVDKMAAIDITPECREGLKQFEKLDMGIYAKKIFSMFGGEEESVEIRFANELVGVVIDRFGKDVMLSPNMEGHFCAYVRVYISPVFYGWLCGFGNKAKILGPAHVAADFQKHVEAVLGQ